MADANLTRVENRIRLAVILVNLLGALATQFYLTVIDPLPTGGQPLSGIGLGEVALVLIAVILLLIIGTVWGKRSRDRIHHGADRYPATRAAGQSELAAGTTSPEFPRPLSPAGQNQGSRRRYFDQCSHLPARR